MYVAMDTRNFNRCWPGTLIGISAIMPYVGSFCMYHSFEIKIMAG